MAKRHIDVVCGIVTNSSRQILIALRDYTQDQGGLWEFPGGKVEPGETLEQALLREFEEEVGLHVSEAQHWMHVHHEYPQYHVTLHVWQVLEYQGEAEGLEHQYIRWASKAELQQLEFPEANHPIINALLESKASTSSASKN